MTAQHLVGAILLIVPFSIIAVLCWKDRHVRDAILDMLAVLVAGGILLTMVLGGIALLFGRPL